MTAAESMEQATKSCNKQPGDDFSGIITTGFLFVCLSLFDRLATGEKILPLGAGKRSQRI